jgi:hypothetical protein
VGFDDRDERVRLDDPTMRTTSASTDRLPNMDRSPLTVGVNIGAPDPGERAWMQYAACRGVGAAEFFGTAAARGRKRCRVCPVREACFWGAIVFESDLGYRYGIWGGATPAVRAQVAWVTGVDYAWARFEEAAAVWAKAATGRGAEPVGAGS